METVLAGLASTAASNMTSEMHASRQMQREQRLMGIQNDFNQANALSAYQNQVQGARMAGLSPALLNGQTPQMAAPVTKGSVSQAENVEIDPATLLLQAQKENIEADTAKKQAEVPNVQADTGKKIAERLYTNAGTDNQEFRVRGSCRHCSPRIQKSNPSAWTNHLACKGHRHAYRRCRRYG